MNGRDRYQAFSLNGTRVHANGTGVHANGQGTARQAGHAATPSFGVSVGDGRGPSQRAIALVVPARPDMIRIVRMAAGVIAARAELPYEDLDDLCLAIDELVALVMSAAPRARIDDDGGAQGHSCDADARLWVRFSWEPGDITVHCARTVGGRLPAMARGDVEACLASTTSGEVHWPPADIDTSVDAAEPLARLILDALVDDYGLGDEDGHPTGWLHKRRAGVVG